MNVGKLHLETVKVPPRDAEGAGVRQLGRRRLQIAWQRVRHKGRAILR